MALLAIGLTDLITTILWLRAGCAVEYNPVMAALLHAGVGVFVLAKLLTLGAYVGVIEWYRRRRNPVFARMIGNITVAAYLCIYAVSFCCVNWSFLLGRS